MSSPLPLPLVDSHVHFWDRQRLDYPWLDSVPAIGASHVPDDYWKEANDVVGQIIFIEAGCAAPLALKENDWAIELAVHDCRIAAVVAQVPMNEGSETHRLLKSLAERPLVRGVRHILQGEADSKFCLGTAFLEGVQSLADFGLSFDLCVHHSQLPSVTCLVDRCPGVRFILDHAGKPDIRRHHLEPWKTHLRELAARPNVYCKLSGLLTEGDTEKWVASDFHPYIAQAVESFGVDRLMFGTDWPVCHLAGSIQDWIAVLGTILGDLPPPALEKIFAANARSCYRVSQNY